MNELSNLREKLAEPFPNDMVAWKPQITTKKEGNQQVPITRDGKRVAGCVAHIDARAVMSRLDDVVGVGEWSDSYRVLENGKNVECTLTVMGVSKTDVGQLGSDRGGSQADPMKTAYSDAFKRAAVKFGIGRYLYDEEIQWLPYDGWRVDTSKAETLHQPEPEPISEEELRQFALDGKELFDKGQTVNQVFSELSNTYPWIEFVTVVKLKREIDGGA